MILPINTVPIVDASEAGENPLYRYDRPRVYEATDLSTIAGKVSLDASPIAANAIRIRRKYHWQVISKPNVWYAIHLGKLSPEKESMCKSYQ